MVAAANRPVRMAGGRRSGRLPLHRHDGVTTAAKITMTMTAVLEGGGSRRSMKRCERSLVQIDTEKGKQEEGREKERAPVSVPVRARAQEVAMGVDCTSATAYPQLDKGTCS